MRQIRPDLWETRPERPFPGLTTHAFLWTPPGGGNVLLYNTVSDADHDEMERLGGVAHQYLSHRDEAGPMLRTVGDRFGARLHVAAVEAPDAARFRAPDVTVDARHVDANGIEVVPTPGHTPGSTCYVITGHDGLRYLFTGDTLFRDADGRWRAGYLPFSDADTLLASLAVIAELEPDLVASSACAEEGGAHLVDRQEWPATVAEVRAGLERHLTRQAGTR